MKKYSILLGAALGIFSLASCQKEADVVVPSNEAVKHIPFELNAGVPQLKTTIDAETWEMDWEDGDVIYAVTTDEEWGVAYKDDNSGESIADFTFSGGKFVTTKEISDGEHTFNFLYTAGGQRSYHRGASTSFSLASTQSEDASNPTASLKANDVLAGQVTATTPTTFANVSMSHLFTLMKVTLKNKTSEDIVVNKFEISATDAVLAGIFNVTFGETPSISLKQNEIDNISVDITNGSIAANGELPVYFVMAPLSNYSGNITFSVSDSNGNTYTKKNTVSGVTFNAGEYNTASYSLKTADPVECVELDWTYPTEGAATSEGISAIPGVTVSGLGSDYTSHSPYCIKFDNTNDFIQVRTDKAIGTVSVKYKMIGGATTSKLEISESTNGSSWSKVEDLTISGTQNSTGVVITSEEFNSESRFVKINFNKGSNIGVGGITIKKLNTDPVIYADNVSGVPAIGATGTLSYTVKNFTDDVTVSEVTGCVSQATASNGVVSYTISPNYNASAATGTIVIVSASNSEITKTINVGQLKSNLSISGNEVIIPASATTATFTVTTADFGYNAVVASVESGMNLSISSGSTGSASSDAQTVTISSSTVAPTSGDAITLGTISVYRNNNNSDPQLKTITVKKAVAGVTTYTLTFPDDNSSNNGLTSNQYISTWTATSGTFNWTIANFNNNNWAGNWTYIKCGRKNNASVATIITDEALPEVIKTVSITIDALTASKINSIKLYSSSNGSSWTEEGSFTAEVGNQSVKISSPSSDKYFKIEFDCASGSSNGLLTLSKVVYATN